MNPFRTLSFNEKSAVTHVVSLIKDESNDETFRRSIVNYINNLFECCTPRRSDNMIDIRTLETQHNISYSSIVAIGIRMIHSPSLTIRRIFILNHIVSRILKANDLAFMCKIFTDLESGIVNRYTCIYRHIEPYQLTTHDMDCCVMRNIIYRIMENQASELTRLNRTCLEHISKTMDSIKQSLGLRCDTLFNEDYPIPRSLLTDTNNSIFDAMDLLTQLTIIGCVDSVETLLNETKKINDLEYVLNLANVAMRYDNDACYQRLTQMITNSKSVYQDSYQHQHQHQHQHQDNDSIPYAECSNDVVIDIPYVSPSIHRFPDDLLFMDRSTNDGARFCNIPLCMII